MSTKFNNLTSEKFLIEDIILSDDLIIDESVEFDIEFSTHGMERSVIRNGMTVNIPKDNILQTINKSSDILIDNWGKYPTFVIHSNKTNLNVIGRIVKKYNKWVFHIITLMY